MTGLCLHLSSSLPLIAVGSEVCLNQDILQYPPKESACNAGDPGSIPGSGRSPGEGNGSPLQYACMENPRDREVWWATVHGVTRVGLSDKITTTTWCFLGFPHSSASKESACNARDPGSVPGSGRSDGEGKGYPLQYSGLENSMDCIVHGFTKSQTQLSDCHLHLLGIFSVENNKVKTISQDFSKDSS